MEQRRIVLTVLEDKQANSVVFAENNLCIGYAGEHLATILGFNLPENWLDQSAKYQICFRTSDGKCYGTDLLDIPELALPSGVMREGALYVQVLATDNDGTVIKKTEVCKCTVGKSIADGEVIEKYDGVKLVSQLTEELQAAVASAQETDENLKDSITSAAAEKDNLLNMIITANNSFTNLESARSKAGVASNNLNAVITNAGTAKTELESAITAAATATTNANEATANATSASTAATNAASEANAAAENLQADINDANGKLTAINEAISDLQTATSTNADNIATLQSTVNGSADTDGTVKNQIVAAKAEVIEENINPLAERVEATETDIKNTESNAWRRYLKSVPLLTRHSNGFYAEHPTWTSRQYDLTALCVVGRYLYTGSHLGFKKWDIGVESEPIDVTKQLISNEYLAKNQYIDQWSINPWGTGGGERIPYKMEFYNGYIFAIVRAGSGFVDDSAAERNPNTNAKGETETEGTVGYFIVMDTDLNVVFKEAYYGSSKTAVGYRKPSGFSIDKETDRIFIGCQLYGWLCYDISNPSSPVLLYSYSPLDESAVSSINGADLSSKCGPVEYQNGCVFVKDGCTYFACAGYVDGIHLWDVTDIENPTEIKNDIVVDNYGLFWQFRIKESAWNTYAHLFDVGVVGNKMYATIAPTTDHGNDENRISGLIVLDISDLSEPTYKYYPIDSDDWNYYQRIGDVKPSHLLISGDKILLNNGNKGIAVYDNSGAEPVYRGCIPSDGDEIYQFVKTDDGRLISGCHIAPYNFRINRDIQDASYGLSALASRVTANEDNISDLQSDNTSNKSRLDADEGNISDLQAKTNTNTIKIADLQAFVGYTNDDILGLQVDYENKTFTRLAGAVGKSAGTDFDKFDMFGGRKRCNVLDDGTITAYYGDENYTEDGSNGQVMVYQPAFYYKVVPLKLDKNTDSGIGYHIRKANYYVSDTPHAGFKLHPAFFDENGNAVDYILYSAYEGSLYSNHHMIDDDSDTTTDWDLSVDILCSLANQKPISGLYKALTKTNAETLAKNHGAGWHIETIKSVSANQLLMMIELGTMNTQTAIGMGVVSITDNSSYNCSSLTGSTAALGNSTGMAASTVNKKGSVTATYTENGKVAVTYRGIENPWGNIWKHVNGINIWGDGTMCGGQPYVTSDFSFSENKHTDNYKASGSALPNANGYISAVSYASEEFDWLLMPSEIGGSTALPVGDFCYSSTNLNGYKIALLGNKWNSDSYAGGFSYHFKDGVSVKGNYIGARLLYVPTARG